MLAIGASGSRLHLLPVPHWPRQLIATPDRVNPVLLHLVLMLRLRPNGAVAHVESRDRAGFDFDDPQVVGDWYNVRSACCRSGGRIGCLRSARRARWRCVLDGQQ